MPINLGLEPQPAQQSSVLKYLVTNFNRIKDAFRRAFDASLTWDQTRTALGLADWVPAVSQGATITYNAGTSIFDYTVIGDLVIGNFALNLTSGGTAGSQVIITPPVPIGAFPMSIGAGWVFTAGANVNMSLAANAAGSFSFVAAGGYYSPNPALANGNALTGAFHYWRA